MLVCNLISTAEQCNTYFLCKEFVKPLLNGVLLLNRGRGVRFWVVCGVCVAGRVVRIMRCASRHACSQVCTSQVRSAYAGAGAGAGMPVCAHACLCERASACPCERVHACMCAPVHVRACACVPVRIQPTPLPPSRTLIMFTLHTRIVTNCRCPPRLPQLTHLFQIRC